MTLPRSPFQLALAVVAGIVTMHLLNGSGEAGGDITSSSRAAIAAHPALVRWRDKLAAIEVTRTAAMLSQKHRADSLEADAPVVPDQPPVAGDTALWNAATQWRAIAAVRDTQARICSVVVLACEQRAKNAEVEAARLALQLDAQVHVKPKRCGFQITAGIAPHWPRPVDVVAGYGCRL